jgi:hypothetical protein
MAVLKLSVFNLISVDIEAKYVIFLMVFEPYELCIFEET